MTYLGQVENNKKKKSKSVLNVNTHVHIYKLITKTWPVYTMFIYEVQRPNEKVRST